MISSESIAIYNYFKTLHGSDHIGKPVSIGALIDICRELHPKRVLEMGGGIGALSYTLLKHSSAFVDIYEDNEFCIGELKKNLKEFEGRFQIITTYQTLPPARDYDVAVIDGGTGAEKDGGYAVATQLFLAQLDSISAVYIEGYRGMQRDAARRMLHKKYVCFFRVYKEVYSEGRKWQGGLRITCKKTKWALLRWLSFLFWEAMVFVRKYYFRLRA